MWLHEWLACVAALKGGEKGTGVGGEKRGGETGESPPPLFSPPHSCPFSSPLPPTLMPLRRLGLKH